MSDVWKQLDGAHAIQSFARLCAPEPSSSKGSPGRKVCNKVHPGKSLLHLSAPEEVILLKAADVCVCVTRECSDPRRFPNWAFGEF